MRPPLRPSRTAVRLVYGHALPRAYDPTLWVVFAVLDLALAFSWWLGP